MAHRGVHDIDHTENTVRSTQLAIAAGADVIEGDMRLTRDGRWVMMHDASVDRTTDGHGRVASLSYTQARQLTTNDGVHGGVPSVGAVLGVLDGRPAPGVQLEIKPARVKRAALRRVLRVFAVHKLVHRLTITSFHPRPLIAIKQIDPRWRTALITNRRVDVRRAKRLGQALSINEKAITPAYAAAVHHVGLDITAWTVDGLTDVRRMVAYDVESISTNQLAMVRSYCTS